MTDSKKSYQKPVVQTIFLNAIDVITASSGVVYETNGVYDGTGEWGVFE